MGDPFEGLLDSGDVLERVAVDITAQARRGDLEPVRCRDAEIARVVDILLRQNKNNPALMGKAGVGKTAIVEGLAQRIAAGDVPPALKDARLVALDHVALLAGTTFRGQYEERIRRLVRDLSADPDLILFVDELHNMIGQGTALGAAMDAANMLKPALVRGDIRVIGATTGGEYDKWIRGDPALERRFQPVVVEELDTIQTWEVLVARRPRLERHHAIAITDDALKAAIVLTERFVPERARPDKAIDVLDEASAHAQASAAVAPELDRLIRERRKVDALIRKGLTHEPPPAGPREDVMAEIFPMLERIGEEIERMLGGQAVRRSGGQVSAPDGAPNSINCFVASWRARASSSRVRMSPASWGPRWGRASSGGDDAEVARGRAGGRDAVGRSRLRAAGSGDPDRGAAAADRGADDAGRGARDGPHVQAPPAGAAPRARAGPRLRHPQVRRGAPARRAAGRDGCLPAVRPDPRLARPAAHDDRPAHRADRRLLRSRLRRAVHPIRHRAVPVPGRCVPRAGARPAASVPEPRLPHPAKAAERPAHSE